MSGVEPGLKLGRVPARGTSENTIVLALNILAMLRDIPDGGFDLARADPK